MPFDRTLLAISLRDGEYAVQSTLSNVYLNIDKVDRLHDVDVSKDNIFRDYVAPMAVWQAKRCLSENTQDAQRINNWLDGLPDSVYFVLMHSAEFETGYGD